MSKLFTPEKVINVLAPYSINSLELDVLNDCGALSIMHWQPIGLINFTNNDGFSCKTVEHINQARYVIEKAKVESVSLLLTPEYSFPYEVIYEIINNKSMWPEDGKLWCLCMEGINKFIFSDFLSSNANDIVILTPNEKTIHSYINTLIYIFIAENKLVILPQLKVISSADKYHKYESLNMSTGKIVYIFENEKKTATFFSLICADMLTQNDEELINLFNREKVMVFNPQLSFSFMHNALKEALVRFLNYKRDCLIITLNWASGTKVYNLDYEIAHGCSAFFSNSIEAIDSISDSELIMENHVRGLIGRLWNHWATWFPTYLEHILIYSINPLDRFKAHPAVTKSNEPNVNKILIMDKNAQIWTISEHNCIVDWNWFNRIFRYKCKYKENPSMDIHCCNYNKIDLFCNSFFAETVLISESDKLALESIYIKYSESFENNKETYEYYKKIIIKRLILENLAYKITNDEFPKGFSHFKNNFEWCIDGEETKNITIKLPSDNSKKYAWIILLTIPNEKDKVAYKIQKKYKYINDILEHIMFYVQGHNGYECINDLENTCCNNSDRIRQSVYINN